MTADSPRSSPNKVFNRRRYLRITLILISIIATVFGTWCWDQFRSFAPMPTLANEPIEAAASGQFIFTSSRDGYVDIQLTLPPKTIPPNYGLTAKGIRRGIHILIGTGTTEEEAGTAESSADDKANEVLLCGLRIFPKVPITVRWTVSPATVLPPGCRLEAIDVMERKKWQLTHGLFAVGSLFASILAAVWLLTFAITFIKLKRKAEPPNI